MGDNKEEPKVETNPIAAQLIENTESVVHQTHEDLTGQDGIGDKVDKTKLTTEEILKQLRRLNYQHNQLKAAVKEQITQEIEKQVKPLRDTLNTFIKQKPSFIFVLPKLPRWIAWLFRIKTEGGDNKNG